jgi:hypothetical protein
MYGMGVVPCHARTGRVAVDNDMASRRVASRRWSAQHPARRGFLASRSFAAREEEAVFSSATRARTRELSFPGQGTGARAGVNHPCRGARAQASGGGGWWETTTGRAGRARLQSAVAVAVAVWPCVQASCRAGEGVGGCCACVCADPTETSLWTGRRRRALELGCCS